MVLNLTGGYSCRTGRDRMLCMAKQQGFSEAGVVRFY
jgi:hypothetical protein